MYRICKLAAACSCLTLLLFATGCGSKSPDDATSAPPTSAKAAGGDAGAAGGTNAPGSVANHGEELPPPANAVKK